MAFFVIYCLSDGPFRFLEKLFISLGWERLSFVPRLLGPQGPLTVMYYLVYYIIGGSSAFTMGLVGCREEDCERVRRWLETDSANEKLEDL